MKHLIVTEDLSSLGIAEYDRVILDSITNKIVYWGGVKYEVIPDSYIYNETDNKYYQKLVAYGDPIETNATVDMNSEWVSDSEDDEYRYFKSNSHVGKNNSYSQCKVTWSNRTSIGVVAHGTETNLLHSQFITVIMFTYQQRVKHQERTMNLP